MRYPVITIFIVLCTPFMLLSSKGGDYPAWPEMPFEFHHLSLELDVSSGDGTIRGIAEYEMSAKSNDVQQVLLFADNMQIELIRVNGQEVQFEQRSDSLQIQLLEPFYAGQRFRVEITYESTPDFGVHFGENGTVWSSMLPKSNRHWLPGFDHPRVELTTAIHLRIQDDHEAVASGYFRRETPAEDGFKDVTWQSDEKLPLSDIGFIAGNLHYKETVVGSKRVRLYSEADVLSEDDIQAILQTAYDRIRETERYLLYEYPYDAFNLVALQDDRWETRSYAAGIGYIFANRGELIPQVANPVYSQWFGVYQRPEQWGDAEATLLHQAWLAARFDQKGVDDPYNNSELGEYSSVYKNFSPSQQQRFLHFVQNHKEEAFVKMLASNARKALIGGNRVMGWDDYARFWYEETGANWFQKPVLSGTGVNQTFTYDVDISHDSISGNLLAAISPVNSGADEHFTIPVTFFRNGRHRAAEQEFSGRGDTLTFDESENIENIAFGSSSNVEFNMIKPFSFWLYQLRRDPDRDRRIEAALALKNFTDEQDLQLALNSVLNREEDGEVKAAVLNAMASITSGAAGVQSWFLSRLDHENKAIRHESLRALSNYANDEIVKRDVFEIISLSDDLDMVNEGISVYRHLIPEADFLEFADQFLAEDEERLFTYTLINELYKTSETDFANERVEEYLEPSNPFRIRYTTWQHLNWNDYDRERWGERVKNYIADSDPRIRYLMMSRIESLSSEERETLLIERLSEEKDDRVLNR